MDKNQREGTLKALFDRMFSRKKTGQDTDGFKLKHGRGLEVNNELFTEDDVAGQKAYQAAGVAIVKDGYMSAAIPTKSAQGKQKKMEMYSSVGAEERRRAISIAEERKNLDYQAFEANGGDVTGVDVTAEVGETLGMTQPMTTTLAGILTDNTPRIDDASGRKLIKDQDGKGDKRYQ